MNAASPTNKSISVGQAAKFFNMLGLDGQDVQSVIDDPDFRDRIRQAFGRNPAYQPVDAEHVHDRARVAVIGELCVKRTIAAHVRRALVEDVTVFVELVHAISPFRQRVIFAVINPVSAERWTYRQAADLMGVPEHRVRANFQAALSDMARIAPTLLPEITDRHLRTETGDEGQEYVLSPVEGARGRLENIVGSTMKLSNIIESTRPAL